MDQEVAVRQLHHAQALELRQTVLEHCKRRARGDAVGLQV
jgi:hypothetical protein